MAADGPEAAAGADSTDPLVGDDLTRIDGVTPEIAAVLHGRGIRRLRDIASWTPTTVDVMESQLGLEGRVGAGDWVGKAQRLIAGGEAAAPDAQDAGSDALSTGGIIASAAAAAASVAGLAAVATDENEADATDAPITTDQATEEAAAISDAPAAASTAEATQGASAGDGVIATAVGAVSEGVAEVGEAAADVTSAAGESVTAAAAAATATVSAGTASVANAVRERMPLRSVRSEALTGGAQQGGASSVGGRVIGRGAAPDDLKRIKGIGVVIEKKLFAMGITTYEQIANFTDADVAAVSERLDFKGRIEREQWIEQAQILVDEGPGELA